MRFGEYGELTFLHPENFAPNLRFIVAKDYGGSRKGPRMGCENDKGSVAAEPESFSRRNGDVYSKQFTNLRRDDNTDCCRFERGRDQLY